MPLSSYHTQSSLLFLRQGGSIQLVLGFESGKGHVPAFHDFIKSVLQPNCLED